MFKKYIYLNIYIWLQQVIDLWLELLGLGVVFSLYRLSLFSLGVKIKLPFHEPTKYDDLWKKPTKMMSTTKYYVFFPNKLYI